MSVVFFPLAHATKIAHSSDMKLTALLLAVLAIAAAVTAPTRDEAIAQLRGHTLNALETDAASLSDFGFDGTYTLMCRLKPDDCWHTLTTRTLITHENRLLYSAIKISDTGPKATCYATFGQMICL